ncbi:MAG: hypothetical protein AAFQ94_06730 [Bacteroidota bacterium]
MIKKKATKFLFLTTFSKESLIEKTMLHCLKHNIEVVRINIEDFVPYQNSNLQIAIMDQDVSLKVGEKQHLLSEFTLIWKRRISNNFLSAERLLAGYRDAVSPEIKRSLISEIYQVRDLLLHCANNLNIPVINDYDPVCLNKPFQSIKAAQFGLQTPAILVSNSSTEIRSFVETKPAITKPLGGFGYMFDGSAIMSVYTTSVDQSYIENISTDVIFPSFLQERIQSQYELKCILVGGEVYCVKQYSVEDGGIPTTDIKTAIAEKKIKKVQYHLDSSVANKVVSLCQYYKLDLCTFDLIYDDQKGYIFIEINPDGIIEYYGEFLDSPIHEAIFRLLMDRAGLPNN